MTISVILEEMKRLSAKERLEIIEAAIHSLREEMQQTGRPTNQIARKRKMEKAAKALRSDYCDDSELTGFTALDR